MTRLLLIRHGESEWNSQGRWQGQADPPLSDKGRDQARYAAESLGAFGGPVVSSHLRRAFETAEIMAEGLGLEGVVAEPGVSEIDVGEWSGLTGDEVAARYPEEFALRKEGRLERFPGGEGMDEFRVRVRTALEEHAETYRGQSVLVVTHGGAIAAMERMLGVHPGVPVPNLGGRWFVSDSELRADGDRILLVQH